MRLISKLHFAAGFLSGLSLAVWIGPAPVAPLAMAGPPSDIVAYSDAPPIEQILASLPAKMRPYVIGEIPAPVPPVPRPRPMHDPIAALIAQEGGL